MPAPSLQDGIEQAGSPVRLLWKPDAEPWLPEVVEREYAGWRQEQAAWHDGVSISDLSHHMFDTFITGPDATRLLTAVSANNYEAFAIGQAKQFVPVSPDGNIVTDGILLREAADAYALSGVPAAQNWVKYHGEKGGYDVSFVTDPSSAFRHGGDPVLFRYQVQGPRAVALVARAFGGPLPQARFFHSIPVTLNGIAIRALRHNMAGQDGYEFIGPWPHAAAVKDALMSAGEPLGLVHVGGFAYASASVESGWIPSPVPAVYTDPDLLDYRKWLPLFGIEDYYCTPYELGYGRSISFNHDFIGRDALQKAKHNVRRAKVTLVFDAGDVRTVLGEDPGFQLTYARQRVEAGPGPAWAGSALAGLTYQTASIDPVGTILSLALVDRQYAEPGTEVTVVWGEHPGPGTPADADLGFPRIRATVQPAPFDQHARTTYRRYA